jgi:hypothetical protein
MSESATKPLTDEQLKVARHALGLPNKKRMSYRNHFCAGPGHADYETLMQMVAQRDAIRVTGSQWGGDDMFYMTWKCALKARAPNEHLSREDCEEMRHRESLEEVRGGSQ